MKTHEGVAAERLRAQRLVGQPFRDALVAVRRFGAVQSQDYWAAKWALGLRTDSVESELDGLLDRGAILRTHVLRPTWHFVLPEDVGWLLELTAPRIRRSLVARYRELEIDATTAARAGETIATAVAGGRHLVRSELGDALTAEGISPAGQRLSHLLMGAELDRLIISGCRRGKRTTYAPFDERAPERVSIDRDEAVLKLVLRYFEGHGPAQVSDFVWWSGLTVADARAGISMAGDALHSETLNGEVYWSAAAESPGAADIGGAAHLLPNFDEYLVGFRDRTAALDPNLSLDLGLFSLGSILSNVLLIGGRVRGSWRRTETRRGLGITVRLLGVLNPSERDALEKAGRRLSVFLERPVEIDLED